MKYKILITSIFNSSISTTIAEFHAESEADKAISIIASSTKHGVVRFAERLN